MLIAIQYPPDFDGELHIQAKKEQVLRSHYQVGFTFTMACSEHETEIEVLVRACKDILRQLNK